MPIEDSSIETAMLNLQLPKYRALKELFGRVLNSRRKHAHPECALFNLLKIASWPLDPLVEDCEIFIREIGLVDAQKKCHSDVLVQVRRPAYEFNGACGDFWAEMAAIRTLAQEGYSQFRALHRIQKDGPTSDYEAYLNAGPVYIEVKNLRSNKTVTDVFHSEIGRLYAIEPSKFAFRLSIDYAYDDPPTAEQERIIKNFVLSLRERNANFHEIVDLKEAVARVSVTLGDGSAFMARGIGPESPEPLRKSRFLQRIRAKAEEALSQMRTECRARVLVINFDSPSAMISGDFVEDAIAEVMEVFQGNVRPYVLHYRSLVQIE